MSRAGEEQPGRERQDQALHGDWNLVYENGAAREGKANAAVPLRQSASAQRTVDDNMGRCVTFFLYTDHRNRVHATGREGQRFASQRSIAPKSSDSSTIGLVM